MRSATDDLIVTSLQSTKVGSLLLLNAIHPLSAGHLCTIPPGNKIMITPPAPKTQFHKVIYSPLWQQTSCFMQLHYDPNADNDVIWCPKGSEVLNMKSCIYTNLFFVTSFSTLALGDGSSRMAAWALTYISSIPSAVIPFLMYCEN